MEEYKELKSDIKDLDTRLSGVETEVAVIKANEVSTKDLVERNTEAFDRLDATMQSVCNNLTENTMSIKHLGDEIAEVKEQGKINEKEINALKDERNINMMTWLKNNWITIVFGVGLVAEIMQDLI